MRKPPKKLEPRARARFTIHGVDGPRPIFELLNPTTGVLWQHDVPESTPNPFYLSVSPDERWILYSATEPLASDIMLVDNYR